MTPLKVHLTPQERTALERIAVDDLRTPEQMLRWLARQEAERRGILSLETLSNPSSNQAIEATIR